MKVRFVTDFKHWLIGINWGFTLLPNDKLAIVVIHFGPWCLLFSKPKEKHLAKPVDFDPGAHVITKQATLVGRATPLEDE